MDSISIILNLIVTLCKYDKKEFVKSNLFESIMPILIDLISKTYENLEFIRENLAPCIGKLCLAVTKSSTNIHRDLSLNATTNARGITRTEELMVGDISKSDNKSKNKPDAKTANERDTHDLNSDRTITNVKQAHYEILQKTRYKKYKTRLAALIVIEEIIKNLGINYEVLWPEAMPIFHELFEDDTEQVEKKCREVCSLVKEIVGDVDF